MDSDQDRPPGLLESLFGSAAMRAVFTERGRLQGMLDFEAALARAEASLGVIPPTAAEPIARACDATRFDLAALAEAAPAVGNTAIPVVRQLTQIVEADDPAAAPYVHWGATSQDAQDTGLVLQLRAALKILEPLLAQVADACAGLAQAHAATLMAGRTWQQHALPITFGLKAAGWLDALNRHRTRLAGLRAKTAVLQLGGAAGTLASLGERGLDVAEALAAELELAVPELPWHTHRDRIVELGMALAMLIGTVGKIARDVSLLMQTDVAEAFEPAAPGRGGSSSMPHKRNPVAGALILTAAVRAPGLAATLLAAMGQEHERGMGAWHAEWTALPELCDLAAGSLEHALPMLDGLEIDTVRMRANLDATRGLLLAEAVKLALAPHLEGPGAHQRVEAACRVAIAEERALYDVLSADAQVSAALPPAELKRLLDPAHYLGMTTRFIDRALAAHRAIGL